MPLAAVNQGEDRGPWVTTFTGRRFHFLTPRGEEIDIRDIAHALANIGRFNGHCKRFYSVAQHSLLVSQVVPEPMRLEGLLHDAAEAYLGDITRPLKLLLPEARALQDAIMAVIAEGFGLAWPMPPAVTEADKRMLMTEAQQLMAAPATEDWSETAQPYPIQVDPVGPGIAEESFLDAFARLKRNGRQCP